MSIVNRLSEIKKLLKVDPIGLAASLDQPSSMEVGMRHPRNRGYMVVRDDEVTEVGSGPNSTLLMDGPQGLAHLKAGAVAIEGSQYLHLHAPPGGLYFGYQRFNPLWFTRPEDPITWTWNAPLVPNSLASLAELLSLPIIIGTPNPTLGQSVAFLGSFIHPQPLFGPNELYLILGRNTVDLMSMLSQAF